MKNKKPVEPEVKPVALPSLAEAIDTAVETLDMDSNSIAFDDELRAELSRALAVVEEHRSSLRVADQMANFIESLQGFAFGTEMATIRDRLVAEIEGTNQQEEKEAA